MENVKNEAISLIKENKSKVNYRKSGKGFNRKCLNCKWRVKKEAVICAAHGCIVENNGVCDFWMSRRRK